MPRELTPQRIYCNLMQELKERDLVVDYLLAGHHPIARPFAMEQACMHLRKMLELIALSSLAAHKSAYSKAYADFAKHWNAELLLRDLERIHPSFYPVPFVEKPAIPPAIGYELAHITEGFLTKEEFVAVYKKCGAMLHASNPFGSKPSLHFYEKSMPLWRSKIARLLNVHVIVLSGTDDLWLIHMQEENKPGVHAYTLGTTPPSQYTPIPRPPGT